MICALVHALACCPVSVPHLLGLKDSASAEARQQVRQAAETHRSPQCRPGMPPPLLKAFAHRSVCYAQSSHSSLLKMWKILQAQVPVVLPVSARSKIGDYHVLLGVVGTAAGILQGCEFVAQAGMTKEQQKAWKQHVMVDKVRLANSLPHGATRSSKSVRISIAHSLSRPSLINPQACFLPANGRGPFSALLDIQGAIAGPWHNGNASLMLAGNSAVGANKDWQEVQGLELAICHINGSAQEEIPYAGR